LDVRLNRPARGVGAVFHRHVRDQTRVRFAIACQPSDRDREILPVRIDDDVLAHRIVAPAICACHFARRTEALHSQPVVLAAVSIDCYCAHGLIDSDIHVGIIRSLSRWPVERKTRRSRRVDQQRCLPCRRSIPMSSYAVLDTHRNNRSGLDENRKSIQRNRVGSTATSVIDRGFVPVVDPPVNTGKRDVLRCRVGCQD